MSELIVWRKQEIDRLRRDIDHLFKRFRREFGVPLFLVETRNLFLWTCPKRNTRLL